MRPTSPVKFFVGDGTILAISDNSSTIKARNLTGNGTTQLWGTVIYKKR